MRWEMGGSGWKWKGGVHSFGHSTMNTSSYTSYVAPTITSPPLTSVLSCCYHSICDYTQVKPRLLPHVIKQADHLHHNHILAKVISSLKLVK